MKKEEGKTFTCDVKLSGGGNGKVTVTQTSNHNTFSRRVVAGGIGRFLMPGDPFEDMAGPKSWGLSLLVGLGGALLGFLIFTVGLGIGDTDVFDWGGTVGAIIGVFIVLVVARWVISGREGPTATSRM